MKMCWGRGCIAPRILDLGTRRSMVSFTPQPLYTRGKSSRYPLDRRLGGPQSQSGRGGEEKNFQSSPGIETQPPIVQPVASHHTDWAKGQIKFWKCLLQFRSGSPPPHHSQDIKSNINKTIILPLVLYGRETYTSSYIITKIKHRRMKWAGNVTRMGEMRNVHKVFAGKPEGKTPLGWSRRR
jgi:hypothetical protein